MFDTKKTSLKGFTSGGKGTTKPNTNKFIAAGEKSAARTLSGNGAEKFSTTGNEFIDQFSKLGTYKAPRLFKDIAADCEKLWAINPLLCVCFIFYTRTIPRVVQLFTGQSTSVSQKGGE